MQEHTTRQTDMPVGHREAEEDLEGVNYEHSSSEEESDERDRVSAHVV